jgi:uncharacterized protein YycO
MGKKTVIKKGIAVFIIILFFFIVFNSSGATNGQINIKKELISKSSVPSYVRAGDIVFMECGDNYSYICPGWDHSGIYVGNNEFIHASPYLNRVAKQNLSLFEPLDIEFFYGKVISSNEAQRINVINFAEGQIGKPYKGPDFKDPSFDSKEWYCSELVWAAYFSQGIDLDVNGWKSPHFVTPLEICWDDDVEMYTYHEFNKWYPGFFLFCFVHDIIIWLKNL